MGIHEPEPEDELVLERFGVKTSQGSKIHFVSANSLWSTICDKFVGNFPRKVRFIEDGKFVVKKKHQCGKCRQQLNQLTNKGVKVRLLRVEELNGQEELES